MLKSTIRFSLFFIVILCISCHSEVTSEGLGVYINNPKHGLIKEKQLRGVEYVLKYKSPEQLALQELKGSRNSNEGFDSLVNKYSQNVYFILSISQNGQDILNSAGDYKKFGELLEFLSFDVDKNLIVTTSKNDTLPILQFVYPRLYDMANSADILFCFRKPKLDNSELINIRLKDFGLATGDFFCQFKISDIQSIPKMKQYKKQ